MHRPLTPVADRFEIVELPRAAAGHTFADDVLEGLSAREKQLPSKYFYDDLGSALFEAITHLPEYYLTAAETEILREWGWEIVRMLEEPVDFLELGSGSAVKTRLLIGEALRAQKALTYSPIDISIDALRSSSMTLVESFRGLSVRAYAGDYFAVLASNVLRFGRRVLAMLMGSNIGNYTPADAKALVKLIGGALRRGDGLLLGTDRKKDARTLERAYDDPTGVTAAFNKNLLGRINRELGGTFDVRSFRHVARYDEERGCVDSFLEAARAQRVWIEALGKTFRFGKGERIHTESSYKFDDGDVAALAAGAGFNVSHVWHDRERRFSVHLLVKT
jgi:L-histidine N-alpha-methyltransferase